MKHTIRIWGIWGISFSVLLLAALWASQVLAYESYHDPNQNDQGYCSSCHPGFAGGRSDTLHQLHTGGTSSLGVITSNCNLCHTGSGRDNPLTVWSTGDSGNGLGCAGCHGRDYGETIGADHRGFPIAGLPKASGWGLRNFHYGRGVTLCVSCHGTMTVQAENIPPPYYSRADVNVKDSCADNLDNDGDGLVDSADPDCAPAPDINLNPAALNFGVVLLGNSSTLTAQVENLGAADLTVSIARAAGTSSEFTFTPAAFTVLPGGSQTLSVTYTPVDVGSDSGGLEISSNDPDEPVVTLSLSGSGVASPEPDINLNPSALAFGTVFIGNSSTLPTQIQNLGNAILTVTGIALCGSTSTEFSFTPLATPFTIPVGGSQTVDVTYAPVNVGADTGCLDIASDDPDEAVVQLGLSGTGDQVPDININPAALDFGVVDIGSSSVLNAQIENLGSGALTVDSIALAPGTSMEFSFVAPATPFTIPPGSSQTVQVTYAPDDVGLDPGGLEISSNDPDEGTVTLGLTGTGQTPTTLEPDINLNPGQLEFGVVFIGSSKTMTTEIQNLGTDGLTVHKILPAYYSSPEFSFAPAAPFTIPPGGSQTLSVTYAPVNLSSDLGGLEMGSTDPDEPWVTLSFWGFGQTPPPQAPDINLDQTALEFGTVFIGSSKTLTAQIQNKGNADLIVNSITSALGTSGEFSFTPDAFTIPPGGSQTLSVTYKPVDVGSDSGGLEISSNDPDEPVVTLNLSGSGVASPEPDINLNPSALAFGTVFIGNSSMLPTQIQNLGNADLTVTGIARCVSTSTEFSFTAPATPFIIPVGGSQTVQVTYAPGNVGADTGCLDIASNDPDEPVVQLGLSGTGGQALDLDIAQFKVTNRVRVDRLDVVEIMLEVKNDGIVNSETRPATVIGWQNGIKIYDETMNVSDSIGDGRTEFRFPAYTPETAGDITWTVTIADDDPDVDQASATTRVT